MTTIGGIHVTVEGRHRLPAGGSIAAIAAHRSWFDGPLLMSEIVRPRLWYIASAEAIFKFPGMEWAMRRFGGMVPVHRGGVDIDVHVTAAQAIIDAGAVFGIYPEGTRTGDEVALTHLSARDRADRPADGGADRPGGARRHEVAVSRATSRRAHPARDIGPGPRPAGPSARAGQPGRA